MSMMKVCIVTVYDSINSGSYWQAFTLGQAFRSLGNEVCYFRRKKKGSSSSAGTILKFLIKRVMHGNIIGAADYLRQAISFSLSAKEIPVIDSNDPGFTDIDLFVLGSDTIWNIEDGYFDRFKAVFWGDVFREGEMISYAASAGNTQIEKFVPVQWYAQRLQRMKTVSVRDDHTRALVKAISGKDADLVCDPTLLFDAEYYKEKSDRPDDEYIFLYLFQPLSREQDHSLRQFADEHRLRIICGTDRKVSQSFDRFVINSPENFLKYMLWAKIVITDTYHGTIFSINFRKNFCVIDRGKTKVNEFVSWAGLENRILSSSMEINEMMASDVDYSFAADQIQHLRESSIEFIRKQVTR